MKELNDYQLANKAMKDEYKALLSEDYQVVIKLPHQELQWRITYNGKNGSRVKMIEELSNEVPVTSSTFRGKSCTGFCSADIKYFKPMLMVKATDLITHNSTVIIDAYFKQH